MSELTDKMRTCAAHILADPAWTKDVGLPRVYRDAADLLLEASNAIEGTPPPLGEPMAIIAAMPTAVTPASIDPPEKLIDQYRAATGWAKPDRTPKAVWTTNAGDLPAVPSSRGYRHPRVCPECDSRATKRVFRHENKVMLACPVCAFAWEYKP